MDFKTSTILKKTSGMALVEAILSGTILMIGVVALYTGIQHISHEMDQTKVAKRSRDIVLDLITNYSNVANYLQPEMGTDPTFPLVLPVAWKISGEMIRVSDCEKEKGTCNYPGRMGVILIPSEIKGLYKLKVKLTHPDWPRPKTANLILGAK